MPEEPKLAKRLLLAVKAGLLSGLKTTGFLAAIMVPVTLAVALLGWSGLLARASGFLSPLMAYIGLRGDAALVMISSIFLNIYSAIAVIHTVGASARELCILAIFCLTAHNMITETAVMKKTGSSALKMILMRLAWGLAMAWLYNLILPLSPDWTRVVFAPGIAAAPPPFVDTILAWAISALFLTLKLGLIVLGIMVFQKLLEALRVGDFLAKLLSPLMRVFGLTESVSFLWIVINLVGYAYGAAVILEQVGQGRMKRQEADLFNHHAALCHSLLEDTVLFASAGASLLWITLPRLVLAIVAVWLERARRALFRRSLRAGVM